MFALPNVAGKLTIILATLVGERLLASAIDFDGSSYARNVSLDADLDVFWTIDDEADTIRVAVHAKAATGWAGVGFSEMGGMEGADIVFYETAVCGWRLHRNSFAASGSGLLLVLLSTSSCASSLITGNNILPMVDRINTSISSFPAQQSFRFALPPCAADRRDHRRTFDRGWDTRNRRMHARLDSPLSRCGRGRTGVRSRERSGYR